MRKRLRPLVVILVPLVVVACKSGETQSEENEKAEAKAAASEKPPAESESSADDEQGAAAAESDETSATATLSVEEMVCQGCARAVKSNLTDVTGVSEVSTSFEDDRVEVTYDPEKVQPDRFVEALSDVEMSGQKMDWDVEVVGATTKGESP